MPGFRGSGPSAGELSRRLADDIERVAEAVLADCRRDGSELRGHGSDGALWVVETRGRKRGLALNAADPDRSGDPLAFVANARFAGDTRAAYAWAVAWFGETSGGMARHRVPPPAAPEDRAGTDRQGDEAEQDERKRRRSLFRYLSAEKSIAGTPAEAYLAGRGLACALPLLSKALRFAPACFYSHELPELPALVAPVIEPSSRKFMAAHCTYLAITPDGVRKLNRRPAKKVWGRYAGGLIPLTRGFSNKPLKHAPDLDGCLIAEGIENALVAAWLRPELRAFAGVAVGNLAAIALPEQMASVVLVCDRDGENDGVTRARERAVNRWLQEGRGVEFLRPPEGHKDMAAWLETVFAEEGTAA
ncbi:MAG TPA: toprim domain-containing protein [Stellaceae bacterium]|nr:toprim domain-containing protein [Stellaceae bacterium]